MTDYLLVLYPDRLHYTGPAEIVTYSDPKSAAVDLGLGMFKLSALGAMCW